MPLVNAFKVPLGTSRGNPPFENLRHYFFDAGGDMLLAFFEMPKGAKQKGDRDALAAMQHCSFAVTEERFKEMVQKLKDTGVPVTGPIKVDNESWSVYFYDPNDIRLEFTCQTGDGDDVRVLERWTQTRDEIMVALGTLTQDRAWLERAIAHLPTARQA